MNTTTPDGYTVNPAGAWTVNGVIQTQQVTPSTTTNNIEAKYLRNLTPVSKSAYSVEESWRTNQNSLWSNVIRLSGALNNTHVEFYTGKEYNWLSAQIAPAQNFDESVAYVLEIYGDNDTLLVHYCINF